MRVRSVVRVGAWESEWFHIRVDLSQARVILSQSVSNMYMDGEIRNVRKRVGEKKLSLCDARKGMEWKLMSCFRMMQYSGWQWGRTARTGQQYLQMYVRQGS